VLVGVRAVDHPSIARRPISVRVGNPLPRNGAGQGSKSIDDLLSRTRTFRIRGKFRVPLILPVGIAGGSDDLTIGDVLIADEVISYGGR
jgi:hypothetical protein